jgi:hypothetical protein
LLLQMYVDSKSDGQEEHQGDEVSIPDAFRAIADMAWLFITYVSEAEQQHGGDFEAWLQRAAAAPYLDADGGAEDGAAPLLPPPCTPPENGG